MLLNYKSKFFDILVESKHEGKSSFAMSRILALDMVKNVYDMLLDLCQKTLFKEVMS